MRKIEAKLGGSDKGALLVDVIAKHLTKGKVEDVGTGVVVAERPAAKLYRR